LNSLALTLALVSLANTAAIGAVSYTTYGATVSQNFDTLITTGIAQAWSNDVTLPGWSLFRGPVSSPVAIGAINAGDGSQTVGSFYSYGSAGASDRALGGYGSGGTYFGSPTSGSVAGWMSISLTNDTGITLDTIAIGYDGEQWRNGGNATAHKMVLQYGTGATFAGVSTWSTPGGTFDFTGPVATTLGAAVDGNVAGKVAGLGGTLTALTWNTGDTLWIRWIENNDAGNDHGLSIDNFTFAAVPEPSTGLLGLIVAACLPLRRRRK